MKATVLLAALMGMAASAFSAPVGNNFGFGKAQSRNQRSRPRTKAKAEYCGNKLAKLAANARIGVCHK